MPQTHPHAYVRKLVPLAVAVLALGAVALPSAAVAGTSAESVTNVRDSTAIFHDPAAALAGGYSLMTDKADLACLDQPGSGAMGVHYRNSALFQSGTIDAARPQALVYQRTEDGRLQLGAVEYIVLQADWDATHSSPPSLFGQTFMLMPAENRMGWPAFYQLHAWVWQANPSGMFSMWNPGVTCTPSSD
jgi:hypothetical protein